MFLFRWIYKFIKGGVLMVGLATIAYWGYNYMQAGSPLRKKVEDFRKSSLVDNSVKDVQTLVNEVYKGVGGKGSLPIDINDISKDEKKQVDDILAKELAPKKQDNGSKNGR